MDLKSIGVGRAFLPSQILSILTLMSELAYPAASGRAHIILTLWTIDRTTKKKDCFEYCFMFFTMTRPVCWQLWGGPSLFVDVRCTFWYPGYLAEREFQELNISDCSWFLMVVHVPELSHAAKIPKNIIANALISFCQESLLKSKNSRPIAISTRAIQNNRIKTVKVNSIFFITFFIIDHIIS